MQRIIFIIILCIISSTATAHSIFPAVSDDPKVKLAISDLQRLSIVLDKFFLDNGFYPTTRQGIKALYKKPTINPIPLEYPVSGYMEEISCVDPWGNDYVYKYIGKNDCCFIIMSYGADGKIGGKGLDADILFFYNNS